MDCVPNGTGSIVPAAGGAVIYEGGFRDGEMHGFGIYAAEDGSIYSGKFKGGTYHGYGQLTLANGTVYSGNFRNGQLHGHHLVKEPNAEGFEYMHFEDGRIFTSEKRSSRKFSILSYLKK